MEKLIIGTRISLANHDSAVQRVLHWVYSKGSRYVCVANVHMLMEAHDSSEFKRVVNNADMTVPDGMPLVWMLRLKGQTEQQRVYGPELMLRILEQAARDKSPVGFYGGTAEVLKMIVEKMQARYENLNVVFSLSPPFRLLEQDEDEDVVRKINKSGVRILFVGLGCPKQEMWMAAHRGRVNAVMIGVGAAFDFHAGMKPQAPIFMQRIGMEWVFRLFTEPRRLWKRYLYHNPRFIFLAAADLLGLLKE